MDFNAFIVAWTMHDFTQLKKKLTGNGFAFSREGQSEHIRVTVPIERLEVFASLCQAHLNEPFNYVDIQFSGQGKTAVVFQEKTFVITSPEENELVKQWAIGLGLPPEQAEWSTSY
ncbi:MAG: hypothetical protein U9R25_14650 [Chloroflexota bacterium]|nr:hypothetical protein [Chloroflexota bacterium]